jgi:hypothetical protein
MCHSTLLIHGKLNQIWNSTDEHQACTDKTGLLQYSLQEMSALASWAEARQYLQVLEICTWHQNNRDK